MHGAGAAERHATAELRAGHAEHVAQHPEERCVAVDIDTMRGSVDFDEEGHGCLEVVGGMATETMTALLGVRFASIAAIL
jgi:hypothetical protein